jgi:hypothetical protein
MDQLSDEPSNTPIREGMAGLELRDERRVRTSQHSQNHVLYHRYVYMAPFEARVSANERLNYLYYVRGGFTTAGLHHTKRSVKYPVGRFTIVERRTRRNRPYATKRGK